MVSLPRDTGVSLKAEHFEYILHNNPDIAWFEIHPENYMVEGGPSHYYLEKICHNYPLSMHGVGMSLGSADGIDHTHLNKLKLLIDRYQPTQVSEHLSWSSEQQAFLNDLLPLPYTRESLEVFCENVEIMQDFIQRTIIIENPSTYLHFDHNEYSETDFLRELCQRTGCQILLDINNIYVSCQNNGFCAEAYLNDFPLQYVREVHLAGHTERTLLKNKSILIDDHGSQVHEGVWKLFRTLIKKSGQALPTLVEWDTNLPEFTSLKDEADKAKKIMIQTLACKQKACN